MGKGRDRQNDLVSEILFVDQIRNKEHKRYLFIVRGLHLP